jgi:hypothetical protein
VYFFALLWSHTANAQDLAAAKQLWQQKRMVAAKEAIDTYLNDTGEKDAEGWLLKAEIYNAVSTDLQLKSLVADGKLDAFSAIKRAAVLNPKLVAGQLAGDKFAILHTIYTGFANEGVALFNAAVERKSITDYGNALDQFKKALQVSDFAAGQGWKPFFIPSDSVLLYNAAQSAINAAKEDEALLYSRKLADRPVYQAGAYKKPDFENIYQWLVNYYNIKKDGQNLQKYAAVGAKIYPMNLYFAAVAINNYKETGNYPGMIAAYEAAVKHFPQNNDLRYSFCNDLFAVIYKPAEKIYKPAGFYQKLEAQLQLLIKNEPDTARGYLLLGKHYYNKAADLQKAGAAGKTVLSTLNQAIKVFKTCTQKAPFLPDSNQVRKESFELLIAALKAAGRKGEADAAFTEMMGL